MKMRVTLVIGCLVGFVAAKGKHDEAAMAQKGEHCQDDKCAGRYFGGGLGGGNFASNIGGGGGWNYGGNIGGGGGWRPRSNIGGGWRPGGSYQTSGGISYPPIRSPPAGGGGGYPGRRPWQIGGAVVKCYECGTGTLTLIGKIEHMILSLPLAIIRGIISIPAKILGIAINLGSALLTVCNTANDMLMSFIGTLFEIPAKVMLGGVNLFLGFLHRVLGWGHSCEGQEYCQAPLPAFNGIGPCAGQWPCRQTIACNSATCYNTSRDLEVEEEASNMNEDAF